MTREQKDAAEKEETVETSGLDAKNTLDVTLDEGFGAGASTDVRRRLSTGSLIMGGVLLLAAVSLWSMRAIDRAAASGPVTSHEIEKLFDDALKSGSRKGAKIETDASRLLEPPEAARVLQIPLKDLTKDPFVLWRAVDKHDPVETDDGTTDMALRISEWEAMVDDAAQAIKVQSTMEAPDERGIAGIANVNGHMMRAGDLFTVDKTDIEFTVDRIVRNEVTFRAYNVGLRHERLVIVKVNRKF